MLKIESLTVTFGSLTAVDDVSLTVGDGEILCILGPSGCGKSTLLRAVAGLERPDKGEIVNDGRSVRSIPVHQRGFGFMFQDYALFPHMTVAENVAFGLKTQTHRADYGRIRQRVDEVLALVGLTGFEDRDVTQLSGGERQRVALARSLAPKPDLLMLDEPLGALDKTLKDRLVIELRQILKAAEVTTLYVTHDQQEAFVVADRVAVMNRGRMEQIDTPEMIYRRPQTVFTARFLGLANIYEHERLQAVGDQLSIDVDTSHEALMIHPQGIALAESGISVEVVEARFSGDVYRMVVDAGEDVLLRFHAPIQQHSVKAGQHTFIRIDPAWVVPLGR